jgi:signal transduction histidine kinase
MERPDVLITVVMVSLSLLVLTAMLFIVLIGAANRRHRHRAEMAELHLQRDREVQQAEREATQHALTEVGRELHDNVGQLLTVAQVGLRDVLDAATRSHPRVRISLGAIEESLDEVRRLGRSLDQDRWQDLTLRAALEAEALRLERLGKAHVLFRVAGAPADPDHNVKTLLFRSFQEVVSNALRHSDARTMDITLGTAATDGNCITVPTLHISDDGRGFDPGASGHGNGSNNIRRRCALVGYAAQLDTSPGKGTTWTFTPDGGPTAYRSPG